jgi:TetR/AcrR family transcriptional regulator
MPRANRWKNVLPSRQEQKDLKLEVLYHQAALSFNRRGFHGTSLDDIASTLGITKTALYHYVANKNELLYQCLLHSLETFKESLKQAEQEGRNGRDRVLKTFELYATRVLESSPACVTLFESDALEPGQADKITSMRTALEKRLRGFIAQGIEDGSIAAHDVTLLSNFVVGCIFWITKWYSADGRVDARAITASISSILKDGISA